MFSRTPLAWKNLVADWRRLGLACAGVAFASVLMFMQNGFRNALLDSPVQWLQMIDCDLVAISVSRNALPSEQPFPRDLLRRASGDMDVEVTSPMYIERMRALVRVDDLPQRPIRVIGLDPSPHWFHPPSLREAVTKLDAPRTAVLDRETRPQFGFETKDLDRLSRQQVELSGRSIKLVGTITIGSDFANEGTMLMSPTNFAEYFSFRNQGSPLEVVDLGLIQLRPGSDPDAVAERLNQIAPDTWLVMTHAAMVQREIEFWNRQTPIGMIFFIGALMGFAVGVIICYQILFTSIHDSMPEFATLKAMGYRNQYFVGLVIRQSIYLSVLGFIPAILISFGMFELLESLAGLPMLITWPRALLVLGLTTMMCLVSGLLALRKLISTDPASLF